MRVYVGMGSNLGDRWALLESGVAGMERAGLAVEALSSVWETEPVGTTHPAWFLNMVARLRAGGLHEPEPLALLELLLAVERDAGRRRGAPNAPRTLDLDLLLVDDLVLSSPRLVLPHPRMWERSFVLEPLAEIAPALRDPRTGRTVAEAARALRGGAVVRRIGRLARAGGAPL